MWDEFKRFWKYDFAPLTKTLILLMIGMAALKLIFRSFNIPFDDFFALNPTLFLERPWTLITYIFVDSSLLNIIFAAIWMWFIGASLEFVSGFRGYLQFFLMSTLLPAVSWLLVNNILGYPQILMSMWVPLVGITWLWATIYPENEILVWGIFNFKAHWVAWIQLALVFASYADCGILEALASVSAALVAFVPQKRYFNGYGKSTKTRRARPLKVVK